MERIAKILYLEQNMSLYKVYFPIFEDMGYFIQHVTDIYHAMNIYETQFWDLVLIHYDPILENNQNIFIKNIRKKGDYIPIIAISFIDCWNMLYQGLDDYFIIGSDMNVIKARIDKAIERHNKQLPQIKDHNFLLSTHTTFNKYIRLLTIHDKPVKLKTTENQLLWIFCLNINKLVYTKDICENIWGIHNEGKEAALMRYIHFLRKLLIDDNTISILNEYGKGYKLVNVGLSDEKYYS